MRTTGKRAGLGAGTHACAHGLTHTLPRQACQNKVPQTGQFKPTRICCLAVLEVKIQNSGTYRANTSPEGASLPPPSFWSCHKSLVFLGLQRLPSTLPLPSYCLPSVRVGLCLSSSSEDTSHVGLRAHLTHSSVTSSKTLFPSKITLTSTGGQDFNIYFWEHSSTQSYTETHTEL